MDDISRYYLVGSYTLRRILDALDNGEDAVVRVIVDEIMARPGIHGRDLVGIQKKLHDLIT